MAGQAKVEECSVVHVLGIATYAAIQFLFVREHGVWSRIVCLHIGAIEGVHLALLNVFGPIIVSFCFLSPFLAATLCDLFPNGLFDVFFVVVGSAQLVLWQVPTEFEKIL